MYFIYDRISYIEWLFKFISIFTNSVEEKVFASHLLFISSQTYPNAFSLTTLHMLISILTSKLTLIFFWQNNWLIFIKTGNYWFLRDSKDFDNE